LFGVLILGSFSSIPLAEAQIDLDLESCLNGALFTVQGELGTAGTLGVDYELGTYLAGGNGGLGHGFGDQYNFQSGHFITNVENGFVSTPVGGLNPTGAIEATDHNWLQGTTLPVVVDLGAGNAADQAIVFNSLDHLGVNCANPNANELLWDAVIEGIEFTVYGTNVQADALAAAATAAVFNPGGAGSATEGGIVPAVGAGSTFEQGTLDYVFNDGWFDHGAANEGDDFASVWQFTQPYRYIAVFSHFTDPFVGDNFRSFDNELDAIGRFLTSVGSPCLQCGIVGGEFLPIDAAALLVAGASATSAWLIPVVLSVLGIGLFVVSRKSENS